jgi:nucleotide-binding universal stress UspA family protein
MLKILIPTDFSVQAEFAYLMVKKLAEKVPVEINFLHILNTPDTVTLDANGKISTCGEIDVKHVETQKAIADRNLQQLVQIYGPEIRTRLVFGKVTEQIIAQAEKENFDLICMGTKGAWGLKEKISGTETQMVARKSKVPVLSLMCDRSELVIKNILLVHNFKEQQSQDLKLLHQLINAFDARVHLLQISKTNTEEEKEEIHQHMKVFANNNQLADFSMHVLQDKDVENGVIHFNQMNNMDMICIGTHAKTSLFHSSATEKLINHLFKPIISFHLKN